MLNCKKYPKYSLSPAKLVAFIIISALLIISWILLCFPVLNREFFRPSEIMISKADPSKARKELGWEPQYAMPQVVEMLIAAEKRQQV